MIFDLPIGIIREIVVAYTEDKSEVCEEFVEAIQQNNLASVDSRESWQVVVLVPGIAGNILRGEDFCVLKRHAMRCDAMQQSNASSVSYSEGKCRHVRNISGDTYQ